MGGWFGSSLRAMARRLAAETVDCIAEVPPELAACEFDCRVTHCSGERWSNCPRRLRQARRLQAMAETA